MTTWRVEFAKSARRDLEKLPRRDRSRIIAFIEERLISGHPRNIGHALTGPFAGLWSYRVGDFRLIARIEDNKLTILVLRLSNRREVYR